MWALRRGEDLTRQTTWATGMSPPCLWTPLWQLQGLPFSQPPPSLPPPPQVLLPARRPALLPFASAVLHEPGHVKSLLRVLSFAAPNQD